MARARIGAAASGTAFVAVGLALIGWAAGYAASRDAPRAEMAAAAAPMDPSALPEAPLEVVAAHVAEAAAPQVSAPDPFEQLTRIGLDGDALRAAVTRLGAPMGALGGVDLALIDPSLIDDEARACLTRAIYHEARDQSLAGRMAVADVVMNRVASPRYPATVCGVVFQGPRVRIGAGGRGCQFSFACDGSMDTGVPERRAMREARTLATVVLGGWHLPLTDGATHYHADYVEPYWAAAMHETAVIGEHVFYRRGETQPVAMAAAD